MTSIAWNPGTPQHVKDQWIDPMTGTNLKGGYGRGGPQRPLPSQPPQQNPWQQPPRQQNPLGMGLGAMANIQQMTGQMTGFGEQMGGFGEQMGGFGEQLGGYKDEFININDKLQGLEQGISSLTDKFGTQQQQQPQQNFGMNPFGSFNSYNPYFGGLGAFMRPY